MGEAKRKKQSSLVIAVTSFVPGEPAWRNPIKPQNPIYFADALRNENDKWFDEHPERNRHLRPTVATEQAMLAQMFPHFGAKVRETAVLMVRLPAPGKWFRVFLPWAPGQIIIDTEAKNADLDYWLRKNDERYRDILGQIFGALLPDGEPTEQEIITGDREWFAETGRGRTQRIRRSFAVERMMYGQDMPLILVKQLVSVGSDGQGVRMRIPFAMPPQYIGFCLHYGGDIANIGPDGKLSLLLPGYILDGRKLEWPLTKAA
jgi:hypothetical protein